VSGRPLGVQRERRCSRLVSMFARSPRKRPARMAPDTWAASAKGSETGRLCADARPTIPFVLPPSRSGIGLPADA
jgi:hypothetical protein